MPYQLFLTRAARRSIESLSSSLQAYVVDELDDMLPLTANGPDVRIETTPEGKRFFVARLPHNLEAAYAVLSGDEAARQHDFDGEEQAHLVLYGIRAAGGQEAT